MKKNIFLCFSFLLLSGCGTMDVGHDQEITFSANTSEVGIYDNTGRIVCMTPCITQIQRKPVDLFFVAKKEGYIDSPFQLKAGFENRFFRHFLTSGVGATVILPLSTFLLPPLITDLSAGGAYEYEKGYIFINMIKKGSKAELQQQKKEAEIRRFLLLNYDDIQAELAKGEGEKLDALKEMTFTEYNEVALAIEQNPEKEKAAQEVINIYRRQKALLFLQDDAQDFPDDEVKEQIDDFWLEHDAQEQNGDLNLQEDMHNFPDDEVKEEIDDLLDEEYDTREQEDDLSKQNDSQDFPDAEEKEEIDFIKNLKLD